MYRNVETSTEMYGNIQKCTNKYRNLQKCIEIYSNVQTSTQMYMNENKCTYVHRSVHKYTLLKNQIIEGHIQVKVFTSKLDGVGPVDNRPSTDKLHHFVKKKYIYIKNYMRHLTRDM